MKSDVIIIGGGIAGLATGALLAKDGYRAVVLEKGNQPGGRAYAYEEKGFTLNYGAHAMYRPNTGLFAQVLRKLEKPLLTGGYPDPLRAYWSDGDRFDVVGAKPHQVLTTGFLPVSSRFRMLPLMLALRGVDSGKIAPEMRWSEWVDARTSDPALRRFIMALSVVNTYTRAAGELSARAVAKHLKENLFATDYVSYLSGGWGRIFGTLTDALRQHGGELITGARVDTLEVRDGRVVAAIVDGERREADAFVCTLPPQDAPAIADPGTALAVELARWSRMTDVRACCIDLGFSRVVRNDLAFVFDVERDLYYSLHSEITPDLAPAGGQLLHTIAYLSPEDAASEAGVERRKNELLAGLDRFFQGWRDAVAVERTLPNVRVTGARRTPDQYGEGAMPSRAASASNLYFANDARDLPYFLSMTSLAAAMEVADTIGREHRPSGAQDVSPARSKVAV